MTPQEIDSIEKLPTLPGVEKVYVAGGLEEDIVRDRESNGIPLDEEVIQSLRDLSDEMGVEYNIEL